LLKNIISGKMLCGREMPFPPLHGLQYSKQCWVELPAWQEGAVKLTTSSQEPAYLVVEGAVHWGHLLDISCQLLGSFPQLLICSRKQQSRH
jgi:hypothetical protein